MRAQINTEISDTSQGIILLSVEIADVDCGVVTAPSFSWEATNTFTRALLSDETPPDSLFEGFGIDERPILTIGIDVVLFAFRVVMHMP